MTTSIFSGVHYEFEELTEKEIKPTRYYLHDTRKRTTVTVKGWEDFKDGDFDELWEYGKKITSEEEGKAIKDKIQLQKKRVEVMRLSELTRAKSP